VPGLASYTDLGPIAADKQLSVVVTLAHDDAAIAAFQSSLNRSRSAT
jgi:hypothetical protein